MLAMCKSYFNPFHSDGLSLTYIDTLSMELSILYIKEFLVKNSIKCISVHEDCSLS